MNEFVPVDSLDSPRFCGVPTFMRLPQAAADDSLDAAWCHVSMLAAVSPPKARNQRLASRSSP